MPTVIVIICVSAFICALAALVSPAKCSGGTACAALLVSIAALLIELVPK